jgi:predicted ATPase
VLYGRERELGRIAELVDRARRGAGGALVVRGAPGTGKSALLSEAVDAADEVRLVRTRGIESEAPLAFAALHRLLRPLLGQLDQIPPPQVAAVRAAFGQEGGTVPDRFLVFLGALSLLAEAADNEPVLAVVDDAQWLDEASSAALTFVARRLDQEPVVLLFAAREGDVRRFDADDLPDLPLDGLDLAATRQVLGQAAGGDVGAEVW